MRRVLARADQFFAAHGVRVERVMTDNAKAYRNARVFRAAAHLLRMFTRSGRPQTNGKVERFHRLLLEEWACVRSYSGNEQSRQLLEGWLHRYNHHQSRTALGGRPTHRSRQQPIWELN